MDGARTGCPSMLGGRHRRALVKSVEGNPCGGSSLWPVALSSKTEMSDRVSTSTPYAIPTCLAEKFKYNDM